MSDYEINDDRIKTNKSEPGKAIPVLTMRKKNSPRLQLHSSADSEVKEHGGCFRTVVDGMVVRNYNVSGNPPVKIEWYLNGRRLASQILPDQLISVCRTLELSDEQVYRLYESGAEVEVGLKGGMFGFRSYSYGKPAMIVEPDEPIFFAKKSRGKKPRKKKNRKDRKKRKGKKHVVVGDDQIVTIVQAIPPEDFRNAMLNYVDTVNVNDVVRKQFSAEYELNYGLKPCFSLIKGKECKHERSCKYDHMRFYGYFDELDASEVDEKGDPIGEPSGEPVGEPKPSEPKELSFDDYPYRYYNVYRYQVTGSLSGGVVVPGHDDDLRINSTYLFGESKENHLTYHCLGRVYQPMNPDAVDGVEHIVSNCGTIILTKQPLPAPHLPVWSLKTEVRTWSLDDYQGRRALTAREQLVAIALLASTSVIVYQGRTAANPTAIARRAKSTLKRFHGAQDSDDRDIEAVMSSADYQMSVGCTLERYKGTAEPRLDAEIKCALARVDLSYRRLHCRAAFRLAMKCFGYGLLTATVVGSYWGINKLVEYHEYGWSYNVKRHMAKLIPPPSTKAITFFAKRAHARVVCSDTEKLRTALVDLDESIIRLDDVDDEIEDVGRVDVFGSWIEAAPMVMPSKELRNLKSSVIIRMGKQPIVDNDVVSDFSNFCRDLYKDWSVTVDPKSTLDYLKGNYGEKKALQMYEQWYGEPYEKIYGSCKMFVKDEAYVGKTEDTFKPRMIWARHAWFVVNLGPFFASLGKEIKTLLAEYGCLYTSGCTPDVVGMKAQLMDSMALKYEADVSNWDGSLGSFFLDLELDFMDEVVTNPPDCFDDIRPDWKTIKGYAFKNDEGFKVKMDRCRRSGDLWTSCFNSLINFLLTAYTIDRLSQSNVDGFEMLVMGDDNVVAVDSNIDPNAIVDLYSKLGMKLEIVVHDTLLDASYCSGLFVPVDGVWRWGNMPFRQMAKFGINYHGHPHKAFRSLLLGTSLGMLCTAGHLPIFGSFLRAIADSGQEAGIKVKRDNRHLWKGRIQGGVAVYPSIDTYQWFSQRYDMPLELIFAMEEYIDNVVTIQKMPCKLADDLFKDGFEVDIGVECSDDSETYTFDDLMRWSADEERQKMRMVINSGRSPFSVGWEYGMEEREMGMNSSAPLFHAILTCISSVDLEMGISLHQHINKMEFDRAGLCYCKETYGKSPSGQSRPILIAGVFAFLMALVSAFFPSEPVYFAKKSRKKKKKKKTPKSNSEKAAWKKAVGNVMRAGGTAVGTYFGNPGIGTMGGDLLAKITGMGDYTIHSNSLMSEQVTFGNGSIRVRHREYIGDIYSSMNFSTTVYDVNPGLYDTFPWLSVIARNYERYDIRGLGFEFVSTAGYLTTTQAQGVIVMATQYDPDASVFVNRREMESYMYTTSGKVTDPQLHLVECDPRDRPLEEMYLRYGSVDEERFTDLGRFTIAIQGCPADDVILGELWVTYDVILESPRLEAHGYSNAAWGRISNGAYDDDDILGTLQTTPGGTLGLTVGSSGSYWDRLVFPLTLDHGIYQVTLAWVGASTASLAVSAVATNASLLAAWNQDSITQMCNTGTTSARLVCSFVVQVTGKGAYVTFSGATLPGSASGVTVYVVQMGDPLSQQFDEMKYDYEESLTLRGVSITHPLAETNHKHLRYDKSSLDRPEAPLVECDDRDLLDDFELWKQFQTERHYH